MSILRAFTEHSSVRINRGIGLYGFGLVGSTYYQSNLLLCPQVVSNVDAMKYSMEAADKYRSAYMPPSSLAMSVYSDPGKSGYSYLDPAFTKAYLESSKMYMESGGPAHSQGHSYTGLDLGKLYPEHSQQGATTPQPPRSPTQTPEERPEPSSASSNSSASPGAGLPCYYQPTGLLPQYPLPPSVQYHQASPSQPSSDFRRPLTVIF